MDAATELIAAQLKQITRLRKRLKAAEAEKYELTSQLTVEREEHAAPRASYDRYQQATQATNDDLAKRLVAAEAAAYRAIQVPAGNDGTAYGKQAKADPVGMLAAETDLLRTRIAEAEAVTAKIAKPTDCYSTRDAAEAAKTE